MNFFKLSRTVMICSIIGLIGLFFWIYISNFGQFSDLLKIGIESIILYLLSTLLVISGIGTITNNYLKKKNKKDAHEIVNSEYNDLLLDIGMDLYLFLTKQPYQLNEEEFHKDHKLVMIEKLNCINDNIDNYFTTDFFKKDPVDLQHNPSADFSVIAVEIDLERLMNKIKFQQRSSIHNFLNKHQSELPHELKKKLYKLENLINGSPLFETFQELRVENIFTKLEYDFERMKNDYSLIIYSLIDLLEYFSEFDSKNKQNKDLIRYKVKNRSNSDFN